MALSVTYFAEDSFRAAIEREADWINDRKLYFFTARVKESTCEVLYFRVWCRIGERLVVFCGDRITGPVTIWVQAYKRLLEVSQLAALHGLSLSFGETPEEWLPEVPPEELRLS